MAKTLARVPFPYPRELADTWIASTWAQIEAGEAWHLAIIGEENGAEHLVGCIGLTLARAQGRAQGRDGRTAELGYWLGRRFWGQGLAPEAAGRLCRWALANLEIAGIRASALKDNPRSQAVLRRIGLRPAGEGCRPSSPAAGRCPCCSSRAGGRRSPATRRRRPRRRPRACRCCWSPPSRSSMPMAACCWPGVPRASRWRGSGEFPGGKVKPGETPEAALIRELKEELDIDVSAACLGPFTFASHSYEKFHLLMPLYLCRRWQGEVRPVEGQALAWVRPQKLGGYAMPPADKPLVAMLRDFL
ncbi:bifunctional GNAT family N-acetyltransferase/(deoxy)nucleoside triphosphate pyrophosphohydrolase [Dankookia sp. P2]|uniref:bifunctional GNAT family N-acetyltransferase/(deoxy)nucleoside triphosphate pyrophosphohydrolase n=1 Tax=Dankookia sp. P2 TaxID=3423955 RepID=UPI003D67DA59